MLRILLSAILFVVGSAATSGGAEPAQWPVELSIGQFKIHCDFELASSRALTDELEKLSADVEQLLRLSSERKTVHIVLFETPEAYTRYMRNYFPKLPERRALYIQDRGPGMLFTHLHDEVRTDLRHEVTHALLNEHSTPLPLWLDEGLAEYFEVEERLRFGGNPYLSEVAERTKSGYIPSLHQLESVDKLAHFGDAHYRDSWSWIHFLLHRSAATRELLVGYLQRCRSGQPQLEFSRQLSGLMPQADAEYQQHYAALLSGTRGGPAAQ